jgi:hypothetical protein
MIRRQKANIDADGHSVRRRVASRGIDLLADAIRVARLVPGVVEVAAAPEIESLKWRFKLERAEVGGITVRTREGDVTAIIAGRCVWEHPCDREALFRLRLALRHSGCRVVLVPLGVVRRQPRLDWARWIASASGVRTSDEEREAVLQIVRTTSRPTLAIAASVLRHRDAVTAVLSLVARGLLKVEISRPIGPDVPVWVAERDEASAKPTNNGRGTS